MTPIGHVISCFKEKFGTPRQPGLVPASLAEIVLEPEFRNSDVFRELEGFSHIWVIFQFHHTQGKGWHPTVRPPRLGGNRRVGVFASRSPFRPNPIGLSAIRLLRVENTTDRGPILKVAGVDLIDGTPVLDIKPYLPFTDSIPEAVGGYASVSPPNIQVHIPLEMEDTYPPEFLTLLRQTLATDPRPAFHEDNERLYGLALDRYNVHWTMENQTACVKYIEPLNPHHE